MTSLLSQVTPLTRGLLWLSSGEVSLETPYYKDVDYLLNGLLTATLKASTADGGHVLLSENFGQPFYVLVANNFSEKEIASFFELIKTQLNEESNVLLIDEMDAFAKVQKLAPKEVKSKINLIS
jgi:hypothetical protein